MVKMIWFKSLFSKEDWNKWECEQFHKDHHEKYDENVDPNHMYGGVWETGIRCTICGRKWPDPEHIARQEFEWKQNAARCWHTQFGTEDRILSGLSGEWDSNPRFAGQPTTIEQLHEEYNYIRKLHKEGDGLEDKRMYQWPLEDFGLLEDKFFVFSDDCGKCNVEIEGRDWPFTDEWNLLNNFPGLSNPMHPEAKKVWDKL